MENRKITKEKFTQLLLSSGDNIAIKQILPFVEDSNFKKLALLSKDKFLDEFGNYILKKPENEFVEEILFCLNDKVGELYDKLLEE